jgi:colicin import membrane protein
MEAARRELGPGVRVITANRLRRGGVGGFFATEIGVEIVCEGAEEATANGAAGVLEQLVREQRDQFEPRSETKSRGAAGLANVERDTAAAPRARDWAAVAADRVGVGATSETTVGDARSGARRVIGEPLLKGSDQLGLVTDAAEIIEERRRAADAEREREARERVARDSSNAELVARRVEERQQEVLEERLRERERATQIAAERDAERARSAKLEIERDRAIEQVLSERTEAAVEIGRLESEREAADKRSHSLRVEIERLRGEREAVLRREELLREALHQEMTSSEERTGMSSSEPYGVEVLEKLSLPEDILRRVRGGVALAKAIPSNRVGYPSGEDGLVVLVGPGQMVLDLQRKLQRELGVKTSDCAYVTARELVLRETIGVRVLHDEAEIVTWVDGRMDPKHTSILAVEYNASPSWASSLRRVSRSVPYGKWRLVLPATYPVEETRTLLVALSAHDPVIDVVGVDTSNSPARILAYADRIATVDGEPHNGSLWASKLWERACQL